MTRKNEERVYNIIRKEVCISSDIAVQQCPKLGECCEPCEELLLELRSEGLSEKAIKRLNSSKGKEKK